MATVDDLLEAIGQLELPTLGCLDDTTLLRLQRDLGRARQRVDTASADVAAEIARRSARDLGYAGLAQKMGARTPEKLVQRLTGSSIRDARSLVEVGRMLTAEPDAPDRPEPVLAAALRAGVITVDQVRAIEAGLGPATERVSDTELDAPRAELVGMADSVSVEELRAHARVLRDELDLAGVADREDALREKRYLRLLPQDDGMTRLIGLLDPESAARVQTVVDAALSPRRGGPRFVDPADRARAEKLIDDPRSNDQVALDTVVALLDAGAQADAAAPLIGRAGAPVHLLVTQKDLASGTGFARIAGQTAAVSVATAERAICTDGVVPILFDARGRDVLRLGRTRRRFSAQQRIALAARDGGCRRCGRAVSQTEAHHIIPSSHGGDTDIENAILLCRFCHLLVHNTGWRIEKDVGGRFWFVPPPDVDALQRRITAHPPNPVTRRLAG